MNHPLTLIPVTVDALVTEADRRRRRGFRLVQICATRQADQLELTYSFDLDGQMENLRLHVPTANARVPSLSSVYWCAFIYENEMHDLFHLEVEGMAVDFQGNFYQTAVKYPFGATRLEGSAPTGAAAAPSAPPTSR
jgi:ech hydrogenase subunit D